ncbi:DUF6000 family protein [Nonomuraea sp. NPDC048892]|uniref:DUF6000 family protein n=1 Tax=Nonomuraea sp. NPDC048892 TaxID=3154624 RepID=UPI0033D96791
MRLPLSPDLRQMLLGRRYVAKGRGPVRRYLLLHGSGFMVLLPDRQLVRFGRSLARDARRITDHDLKLLLDYEWRSGLTAAWLIGMDRRTRFRDQLGGMLMESQGSYAADGYCFALARFGADEDAAILSAYLGRYFARPYHDHHQTDAMGALLHLDAQRGTDHAARFLVPDGPWARSPMRDGDPAEQKLYMDERCAFADACMSGRPKQWLPRRRRFMDHVWG